MKQIKYESNCTCPPNAVEIKKGLVLYDACGECLKCQDWAIKAGPAALAPFECGLVWEPRDLYSDDVLGIVEGLDKPESDEERTLRLEVLQRLVDAASGKTAPEVRSIRESDDPLAEKSKRVFDLLWPILVRAVEDDEIAE